MEYIILVLQIILIVSYIVLLFSKKIDTRIIIVLIIAQISVSGIGIYNSNKQSTPPDYWICSNAVFKCEKTNNPKKEKCYYCPKYEDTCDAEDRKTIMCASKDYSVEVNK